MNNLSRVERRTQRKGTKFEPTHLGTMAIKIIVSSLKAIAVIGYIKQLQLDDG